MYSMRSIIHNIITAITITINADTDVFDFNNIFLVNIKIRIFSGSTPHNMP
jgi:hypothetical protein